MLLTGSTKYELFIYFENINNVHNSTTPTELNIHIYKYQNIINVYFALFIFICKIYILHYYMETVI